MTPERKAQLEAFFAEVVDREIKLHVGLFVDGQISSEECAARTTNLAEIGACIHTTFVALNIGGLNS